MAAMLDLLSSYLQILTHCCLPCVLGSPHQMTTMLDLLSSVLAAPPKPTAACPHLLPTR